VKRAAAGENTPQIRAIVANIALVAGCVGLLLFILLLSSAILPSWNVLVVLALILGLLAILLRRSLIQIHSKAQIALQETLLQPPIADHDEASAALPSVLREAELRTVVLTVDSRATGQLIRELQLRSETGASIVGIERSVEKIINPGPDEELQAEDRLLLLGRSEQLDAAQKLLANPSV
jgi:CPA2 family monovalent cation:H+ antiporter-2